MVLAGVHPNDALLLSREVTGGPLQRQRGFSAAVRFIKLSTVPVPVAFPLQRVSS